jgi:hypothetical protein
MKEAMQILIEFTRLIIGTIIGIVLLIIVVSLYKFNDLCGIK